MGCTLNKKFWIAPCSLQTPHKASIGIASILVNVQEFSSGIQTCTVNKTWTISVRVFVVCPRIFWSLYLCLCRVLFL